MNRGQNGIWMVIIAGIIAVVVIFVVLNIVTGGVSKGDDAFNQQFDNTAKYAGSDDIDCDGIPDAIDRTTDDRSKCSEESS